MTDVRLKISPPWVTYVNELNALFKYDPDVSVEYDNDNTQVKIYVEDTPKAAALECLLPYVKEFGNVDLTITVVPANEDAYDMTNIDLVPVEKLFEIAFIGNPIYSFQHTVSGIFSNKLTYIVFKNQVVQFFNDNLNDIYGNISTLYQEIASDVFDMEEIDGILFCTDVVKKVGKPLGEWP